MTWLPAMPAASLAEATLDLEALAGRVIVGRGAPENVVAAPVGVLYLRTDGGAKTTLYVKESATSSTDAKGWVGK